MPEPFVHEILLDRDRVPSFERYPFSLSAVRHLDRLPLHPAVTFFIGENGAGKSTLLEAVALAWGFNAEGGSRNFRFDTRASHSPLHEHLRLSKSTRRARTGYFLRAESFFNVATEIEKLDEEKANAPRIGPAYGKRSLHEQSHGEAFMALLNQRFFADGFYILDEPEAALSPSRQMAVLSRLHDLTAQGCQFIIATHSPIIMAYPQARIYQLTPEGIAETAYQDTEHYAVTRAFLQNPGKMLDVLLEE